jgi:predicted ATPase
MSSAAAANPESNATGIIEACTCSTRHQRRRIVLTGGPGAGKTAVLELMRRYFCAHVSVLPESASIIFGGGFPRMDRPAVRRAGQRAIFFVQRELEEAADGADNPAIVLCDRGTVDGVAYWPGPDDYFHAMETTRQAQLARYHTVLHLRTPPVAGYNHQNPLRVESAAEAAVIDQRIALAWDGHPRRFFVESTVDFLEKARKAVRILRDELPDCCRRRLAPGSTLP